MTLAETITKASKKLAAAGIVDARLDAEVLLRFVLDQDRAWLLAHIQEPLPDEAAASLQALIARREKREPLQYITGRQEFWGLEFLVTPSVLIPRPETELIVETVLARRKGSADDPVIVDLCTGSGCIAVSLAKELLAARLVAADLSAAALAIARKNAERHEVADRIRFLEGDLFAPLAGIGIDGKIDIVTANPPYVPAGLLATLQPEVKDHEPGMALVAGPQGTEIHEQIIAASSRFLKPGGSLIMEMGIGQAAALRAVAEQSGAYRDIEIRKDLAGIDRVIAAQKR